MTTATTTTTTQNIAHLPLQDQLSHLRKVLSTNPTLLTILTSAASLRLPNWYLAASALTQTIWNFQTGRPAHTGIHDYDLVYFDDSDLSWEAEDAVIRAGRDLFADIIIPDPDTNGGDGNVNGGNDVYNSGNAACPANVEIRNQARVHLWYEQRFGAPCPPHTSAEAGFDTWIATCAMIGVRMLDDGEWSVYAPRGLSDIFNMVVRPNPNLASKSSYEMKARRWLGIWDELTVMPWMEKEVPLKLVCGV